MRPYKYLIISNEDGVRGTNSDSVAADLAAAGEHAVVELGSQPSGYETSEPVAHILDQDGEPIEIEEV